MPDAKCNGIRLHYTSKGRGSPIVFVSGLSYGEWTWRWVAPQLTARYRVVTFDNRGVDRSDKPAGPYTTQLFAQDTLALMDELDLPACVLVGHSLGGFIAQMAALARPDRIAKLVLLSTSHGGPRSVPPTPAAMTAMSDRRGEPRELIERGLKVSVAPGFVERQPDRIAQLVRYRDPIGTTPESYHAQFNAGLMHNSESRLPELKIPVLIVSGEHDQVVPKKNAELLKARIGHAQVRILEGAGHMLPMECPEELAEVIAAFAAA